MGPTGTCPQCGAALPDEGWEGLCPKCLVRVSLEASVESNARPELLRRFGNYELQEEIARGGMGVVYKARQVSLNRTVALKMILAGQLASAADVQRFLGEAESAARLQHSNIVAIHEIGRHEGQHYFSMDYVEGQNLAEFVGQKPLPPKQAAKYLKIVAEAIHYAHQQGILHRDLKPSNILIDRSDQPRITDFGLAKQMKGDSELTVSGQVLGSPNFMPPEQAAGKRTGIGPAADVYALGAILYFMVTGRPPFVAESLAETLRQVATVEPPAPHLLNPSVPRDLETICLKCLAKESQRRYGSAKELADELERFIEDKPILARPSNRIEKTWRWCRRNPMVASLAGVSIVLLLAEVIGSPIASFRIAQGKKQAIEKLWESYLAQAQANRFSGRAGRRFTGLDVLTKAAAIRPSRELRDEAIACMALVDVRMTREWEPKPNGQVGVLFDPTFERYVRLDSSRDEISVHDSRDDRELMRFSHFNPPVGHVALSPNGQYLAVISGDVPHLRLKVWDLDRGEMILGPGDFAAGEAAFTPDNRYLAATHKVEGPIVIYDLATAQIVRSFSQRAPAWSLAFDPSGKKLAVCSDQDYNVEIRNVDTGQVIQSLPHLLPVRSVCWHPSGVLLATGCRDQNVYVWDVATEKIRFTLKGSAAPVINVCFNHSGDLLASSGWDHTLRFWDFWTERQLVSTVGAWANFSRDDRWMSASPRTSRMALWEVATGRECRLLRSVTETGKGPRSADFSADGRWLLSAHGDGVRLRDQTDFREKARLDEKDCEAVAFHPDGKSFYTAGRGGLKQWPIELHETGQTGTLNIGLPITLTAPTRENDLGLSVSADGRVLALAEGSLVRVFDTETQKELHSFKAQPRMWSVSVSPDGRWVAAAAFPAGSEGIWIWDLEVKALVKRLPFVASARVAFSPDNKRLVAGGAACYQSWEVGSWKPAQSIPRDGSDNQSWDACFSPDGRTMAITDRQDSVLLVDSVTGHELARLEAPFQSTILRLRFSTDGSHLAAVCPGNHVTQLWDLQLVRQQLAAMKLDWDAPPLPPPATNQFRGPIAVTILDSTNASSSLKPK